MTVPNTINRKDTNLTKIAGALVLGVALGTGPALAGSIKEVPRLFPKKESYSSAPHWNLKAENLSPRGHNPLYFPFKAGHKFIMEYPNSPDGYYRKEVQVLEDTKSMNVPGIGKFEAAIIQEEEYYDGRWYQQAQNWFAIDRTTNSVYAFGEVSWEIDKDGNKVFGGSWRAGVPDGNGLAEPGLLMSGTFNLGARYIFDGSESEAFGGSENVQADITITVPAGTFKNCVRVRERGLHNMEDITDKIWCPGVGLVSDTSDGKLVASSSVPGTDLSSFGQYHRMPHPKFEVPVAKITEHEAIALALKVIAGKANAVSIERKRGHNVYVVEIIPTGGGEKDVFVDIESGKVVGTD